METPAAVAGVSRGSAAEEEEDEDEEDGRVAAELAGSDVAFDDG